jgi:hypothetical protein
MDTSPYEALAEAAADGVDFDGLIATLKGGQLSVETPESTLTAPLEAPRSALTEVSEYVDHWFFWHQTAPQAPARWDFLRWVEGVVDSTDWSVPEHYEDLETGTTRSWGQLRITATLDADGSRRYDLRHEADDGADISGLERYDDPRDARDVAKLDGDGEYRPLKTAPTLREGWVFPELGAADLVAAVDFFYPATMENWHREREGDLDISHWHETMARQTGIYGVVQTWDRQEGHEHVEWVAQACCNDSQCLKRREWDYNAETPLETDGGSGVFPCREPCSVVVSAARQWTKQEGEQSITYEFDLTPTEKEQIETVIDAVADGRIDDIRPADVRNESNRLRVRFLRAKLFDEDGNLGGVPTEHE